MKPMFIYAFLFCCIFPFVFSCRAERETDSTEEATCEETVNEAPIDLNDVLASRRSTRDLSSEPLDHETALRLLWAGQGITDTANGKRTAPSPYGKYLLTLLYCDETGVYQYDPAKDEMRYNTVEDIRPDLSTAASGQEHVAKNGALIIITADMAEARRVFAGYAERFVYIEAGHVAQNILLEISYLGLGGCPVGGFDTEKATETLGLNEGHETVYMVPVGYIE
ncbi:MAG: SagB/ThcOx family dehydrogenase [bacterium]|nr:SagB/ThcOx family dehydrogenase [bacterium]